MSKYPQGYVHNHHVSEMPALRPGVTLEQVKARYCKTTGFHPLDVTLVASEYTRQYRATVQLAGYSDREPFLGAVSIAGPGAVLDCFGIEQLQSMESFNRNHTKK